MNIYKTSIKKEIAKYVRMLVLMLALYSCSPTRHIPDQNYYLKENKIKIDKPVVDPYDLYTLAKPVTNRKFFDMVKIKVRVYSAFDYGKPRRLKAFMKKNFGEAPVLLDTNLAFYSASQMKLYMMNNGYFDAKIELTIDTIKKSANVNYHVQSGEPYRLIYTDYLISDTTIKNIVKSDSAASLLKNNIVYSTSLLGQERDRVVNLLRNSGYYNFPREQVSFMIDTNYNAHQYSVMMSIGNPINTKDSTEIQHRQYRIRKVSIFTEHNPLNIQSQYQNLYRLVYKEFGDSVYYPYYIYYNDRLNFSPNVIAQSIDIKPGEKYSLRQANTSFNRLNDLRNFQYINISFVESTDSTNLQDGNFLDCQIYFNPSKQYEYGVETKITNSGGNPGAGLDFFLFNRNAFKRAQILTYRMGGGFEAQRLLSEELSDEKKLFIFNTLELSSSVTLEIPSFVFPIRTFLNKKQYRPKTLLRLAANYQQRPDYNRFVGNFSFGYEWRQSREIRHQLFPLDINSVKINPDSSFLAVLNQFNKRVKEQYSDHLVFASKYSFIYTNQKQTEQKSYSYARINFESVGNVLNTYNFIAGGNKNDNDQYLLFGIPYANYVSTDIDLRHYYKLTEETMLAMRANFGIGIPLLNSYAIPFEKSFFLGGANSMRGWRMRTLGPGSYKSVTNFEQTGDLKLETNIELRFPIWSYFKGAFFADAGNVWLMRENLTIPNGHFQTQRFYKELAVDAGLGLRMDFSFFIIRFDGALKIHDPSLDLGQRWRFDEVSFKNVMMNFAIGYPF
jgi:outer membrane protein assembly factor BamA